LRDSRALPDEVEGFTPLTADQRQLARKVVCANAVDADDAKDLMYMLGVFPGQVTDEGVSSSVSVPGMSGTGVFGSRRGIN
jgi:hypothetical protein